MSRATKRTGFSMLGAIALLAMIYIALPVQARDDSPSQPEQACSVVQGGTAIVTDCSERNSWLASVVDGRRFLGAQANFRDPLY